jgi:hypothetical protein
MTSESTSALSGREVDWDGTISYLLVVGIFFH